MSSYIGKVQVGSGDQILIGSTLSGICSTAADTAAKVVTLPDFDTLMKGVTVHVRFTSGNSVTSSVTLAVGTTTAYPVVGNCICNAGDTIPFTYYEDSTEHTWYANTNIVVAEGTTNGTVKVNGQEATVHGLGTAAYTPTTNYATAAQGTLAENAMPASGGTFTGPISGPAVNDNSASGTLATVDYVRDKTGGLAGLTGAMHFKGSVAAVPPTSGTYESGDVILGPNDKEYVYDGTNWIELGDEGSFVLKTSQTSGSVGSASLGTAIDADDITNWDEGSASNATVSGGVLTLTNSVVPILSYTARTIPNVSVTSANVIVPIPTTP